MYQNLYSCVYIKRGERKETKFTFRWFKMLLLCLLLQRAMAISTWNGTNDARRITIEALFVLFHFHVNVGDWLLSWCAQMKSSFKRKKSAEAALSSNWMFEGYSRVLWKATPPPSLATWGNNHAILWNGLLIISHDMVYADPNNMRYMYRFNIRPQTLIKLPVVAQWFWSVILPHSLAIAKHSSQSAYIAMLSC